MLFKTAWWIHLTCQKIYYAMFICDAGDGMKPGKHKCRLTFILWYWTAMKIQVHIKHLVMCYGTVNNKKPLVRQISNINCSFCKHDHACQIGRTRFFVLSDGVICTSFIKNTYCLSDSNWCNNIKRNNPRTLFNLINYKILVYNIIYSTSNMISVRYVTLEGKL